MVAVSYPGVYIEEVPSGVRTIVGVATSITAFVGRALRGPIDEPGTIFSWGDFVRLYGGLGIDHPMSYAVSDFFLNGGTQAVIARLYLPLAATITEPNTNKGYATAQSDTLKLIAANPGEWGNHLTVEIDYNGIDVEEIGQKAHDDLYKRYNLPSTENLLFNLVIKDNATGQTEIISNVTYLNGSMRQIDRVLQQESSLVRLDGTLPAIVVPSTNVATNPTRPAATTEPVPFGSGNNGQSGEGLFGSDNNNSETKSGLFLLEKVDLFNLLCIPPDSRDGFVLPEFLGQALDYCSRRRAMLIVDSRIDWADTSKGSTWLSQLSLSGLRARNAALFYPRVKQADPLRGGQIDTFVPCGLIAGVIASTDAKRGVWKAPAGIDDGPLNGTQGLQFNLTDKQNGQLNPLGINCLRSFPIIGRVVWGARTLRGADQLADEYKYIPVRRTALFIEESLYRGLQWVVFEPNDEPLWAQIRLNVGAFMQTLFRQGAFQGASPRDAYFVKCDSETTTQNDINLGIVNVVVGFAPLKPAEFVVIGIQQIAGQIEV